MENLNEMSLKEIKLLIVSVDKKIINLSYKDSRPFAKLQEKLIDSLSFKVEFSNDDQKLIEQI